MITLRNIAARKRRSPENRELFSVNLLTPQGPASATRLKAFLVCELLGLTLEGNRALARILQAYRKRLGFDKLFPTDLYDQWVSRRVHGKDVPEDLADQKKRNERRWELIDLSRQEHRALREQLVQGSRTVEHITLRIYASAVLKPQSKGKARDQLLAIAYHLRRQWIHVELIDIIPGSRAQDRDGRRVDHARMLTRGQWQALATTLRGRAEAEGAPGDCFLYIHAPQASGLRDLLSMPDVYVNEDMPPIPVETVEIRYRSKYSKNLPVRQESLASVLRKPTTDELLADVGMTSLPKLSGLTHRQKDTLIETLWKKIIDLESSDGSRRGSFRDENTSERA